MTDIYDELSELYRKLQERRQRYANMACMAEWLLRDNLLNEGRGIASPEEVKRVKDMIGSDSFWERNKYKEFIDSLNQSERQAFLTPYTEDSLRDGNIQTFKLKGYNIGFALKQDPKRKGRVDIISVHNNTSPKIPHIGNELISAAKRFGGDELDHFDGYLSDFYSSNGFREYQRDKWNDAYSPDGWDSEKYGKPDVVYRELPDELRKPNPNIFNRNEAFNRGMVRSILTEELTKKEVVDMIKDALKDYDNSGNFKRNIRGICVDVMQKYFKDMWQKNAMWASSLRG